MEFPERPFEIGSVGLIRSRIDHGDLRGIDQCMPSHNECAAREAHRLFSHRHAPSTTANWKPNQRL
jgi:hypothetical protein